MPKEQRKCRQEAFVCQTPPATEPWVAADRRQWGVRAPNFACNMASDGVKLNHTSGSQCAAVSKMQKSEPPAGLLCFKKEVAPLTPNPVMSTKRLKQLGDQYP